MGLFDAALEHRQEVAGQHRHGKPQQRRPGMAQAANLALQDQLQALEHPLDTPAPTVQVGRLLHSQSTDSPYSVGRSRHGSMRRQGPSRTMHGCLASWRTMKSARACWSDWRIARVQKCRSAIHSRPPDRSPGRGRRPPANAPAYGQVVHLACSEGRGPRETSDISSTMVENSSSRDTKNY